jgi:hypothetical protein
MSDQPRILKVGEEPPPLEPSDQTEEEPRPLTPAEMAGPRQQREVAPAKGKGKSGNRFHVINTFADHTLAGLRRAEVAVWVLLWRDTRPDGLARTAQTDLARRAGVNGRTVKRAIQRLQRAGLVTVVRRGGLFRGPSTYRVNPLSKQATGLAG